ncbi:hypothetical protein KBI33_01195 [Candidatus Shapirobacteria bacterium]|nr:hypothetical protein [Candidatus Shapirobacteria bacterium]
MEEGKTALAEPVDASSFQTEKPKASNSTKINWWLIIAILLLIALLAAGAYAFYLKNQNEKLAPLEEQETATPSGQTAAPTGEPTVAFSSSVEASPSPSAAQKESELISLDDTWNKYINYRLGFSINVPKMMMHGSGACRWVLEGDHSYRPAPKLVPVKVFEEDNMVYIVNGSYAELGGETREEIAEGIRSYFSECNEVINSLAKAKDKENYYQRGWQIIVEEAKNDEDLDRFIKKYFGPDCRLGDRIHDRQEGVYKISIDQGIKSHEVGEAPEETGCFVNYAYAIKYFPEKNKVASWDLGQDFTFYQDIDHPFDAQMAESFEFLK